MRIDVFDRGDTDKVFCDYVNVAIEDGILYANIGAELVVELDGLYDFCPTNAGTARLRVDNGLITSNWEHQTRNDSFRGSESIKERVKVPYEVDRAHRLRLLFGSAATSRLNFASTPVVDTGRDKIECALPADSAEMIGEAVKIAQSVDHVVLCVGLGPDWEAEGSERSDYELPREPTHQESANHTASTVVQSGTPVGGHGAKFLLLYNLQYGTVAMRVALAKLTCC
jgi:beta-glucosidase